MEGKILIAFLITLVLCLVIPGLVNSDICAELLFIVILLAVVSC